MPEDEMKRKIGLDQAMELALRQLDETVNDLALLGLSPETIVEALERRTTEVLGQQEMVRTIFDEFARIGRSSETDDVKQRQAGVAIRVYSKEMQRENRSLQEIEQIIQEGLRRYRLFEPENAMYAMGLVISITSLL